MDIRIVFMGSPEFALQTLRQLVHTYYVVGVVTQPDRPAGRGQLLTPPPVKTLAQELGLPVIQPNRLREPGAFEQLQEWTPDLIVVAAFGQILRQNVLDLPRFGCINVHASLLPRWRGAAPVQAAILHGDIDTGVSIMRMDAGVDTGPVLTRQVVPITPADTTASLTDRLAKAGADLLLKTLPGYLSGQIQPQPQDAAGATYASMLKKEDGALNFSRPAEELARQVMAFNPRPGAYAFWQGQVFKIHRAHAVPQGNISPGLTGSWDGFPTVGTAAGWLVLDEVQPAGKKSLPGDVFLRGARGWQSGVLLTSS